MTGAENTEEIASLGISSVYGEQGKGGLNVTPSVPVDDRKLQEKDKNFSFKTSWKGTIEIDPAETSISKYEFEIRNTMEGIEKNKKIEETG